MPHLVWILIWIKLTLIFQHWGKKIDKHTYIQSTLYTYLALKQKTNKKQKYNNISIIHKLRNSFQLKNANFPDINASL